MSTLSKLRSFGHRNYAIMMKRAAKAIADRKYGKTNAKTVFSFSGRLPGEPVEGIRVMTRYGWRPIRQRKRHRTLYDKPIGPVKPTA